MDANRSLYTFRGYTGTNDCRSGGGSITAQIVSGAAAGHPDIGGRDIVPNLKDSYVYGFVANAQGTNAEISTEWDANELIGLRQSGNQLIIGLFSEGVDNSGVPVDFKDPRKTVILTKLVE